MSNIVLDKEINGSILDIGGGGEGVIGKIYQSQVTAIDRSKDELDEAPAGFNKLVMDACNLEFANNTFENITFFYTLMYIQNKNHTKAIQESYRVLKKGGHLYIWDTNIYEANPFLVQLKINANGSITNTTYGIYKENAFQDNNHFKTICKNVGFNLVQENLDNNQFYLHFIK